MPYTNRADLLPLEIDSRVRKLLSPNDPPGCSDEEVRIASVDIRLALEDDATLPEVGGNKYLAG